MEAIEMINKMNTDNEQRVLNSLYKLETSSLFTEKAKQDLIDDVMHSQAERFAMIIEKKNNQKINDQNRKRQTVG